MAYGFLWHKEFEMIPFGGRYCKWGTDSAGVMTLLQVVPWGEHTLTIQTYLGITTQAGRYAPIQDLSLFYRQDPVQIAGPGNGLQL